MAKILVTGGAGYLGSILVPELLYHGHMVTVFDNFMYHQAPLLEKCYSSNFEVIRGDVTNYVVLKEALKDKEIIIPLACLTGAPLCDFNPVYAESVIFRSIDIMLDVLDLDTKIIYPNTNSGYGIGEKDKLCTEISPLHPISRYGKLKCQAEKLILSKGNSISLRLATVFGLSPRMRLDLLVNDFVYRAINDGFVVLYEPHAKRNYIHVLDVAKTFLHCINNWDTMKNNIYNVGLSSANLSKIELCDKIKEHIPNFHITEATIGEDPDKRDYIVSNEKLEKTGWTPGVTLDTGIKELIKGYQIIRKNQYSNV